MPKKITYDKKTGARNRRARVDQLSQTLSSRPYKVSTINQLLATHSTLRQLSVHIPKQQSWTDWLRAQLDEALRPHVVGTLPKATELIVFADAAVWGTRLRYALAGLEAAIQGRDAKITRTSVRVQRPALPSAATAADKVKS